MAQQLKDDVAMAPAIKKMNLNALLEWSGLTQPVYFGMDIDPTSIFAIELSHKNRQLVVDELVVLQLPAGTMIKNHIEEPGQLTKALRTLSSYGLAGHNSVIATSSKLVTTHYVIMPKEDDMKKLEHQVQTEAKKAFPDIYNDIYLDFIVSKDEDAEKEGKQKILLVAAHKKGIQPILVAAESADIKTKIIDVDYHAIERAFYAFRPAFTKTPTAILNLDSFSALFVVLDENEILHKFHHSFNIPGYDKLIRYLLECICPELITEKNAKRDIQSVKLNETLESQLLNQLDFILKTYSSKADNARLEQLVITGRSALIPNIEELLTTKLGIQTITVNPFSQCKLGTKVPSGKADKLGPACLLACGLAVRNKDHDKY